MTHKFYDTCSLLLKAGHVFDEQDSILVISSITLEELENIKTSSRKDNDVKFAARKLTHELDEHFGEYEIITFVPSLLEDDNFLNLEPTNDLKIISCAWLAQSMWQDLVFITNDLCCKNLAFALLACPIEKYKPEIQDYDGYKEIYLNDDQLTELYSDLDYNHFNLYTNEYALIYNQETKELVDKMCWTGEKMRTVPFYTFESDWFGTIKPYKGDAYQVLAADSFMHNKITMIKGMSGSGKSFLSMGFLMSQLEKRKIDKIIVFCNTVATRNAARLGFYSGSRTEKLLDSQIGNMLASKLGGLSAVERMILDEKLLLLPLSDLRGYDTSGMRAGIYITEAQNMDTELMKLALQRIGEDCICIIDGDFKTQVDMVEYEGVNNGMRRTSEVFRNSDIYGEVTLKTIHRSRIAELADKI